VALFAVMTTWRAGIDALRRAFSRQSESFDDFLREVARNKAERIPGTAVFLTRLSHRVSPLILQHVRQIGAIPQTMVAMTVRFVDQPRVPPEENIELRRVGPSFWHLTVHYGYFELPNVPATFARACREFPGALSLDDPTYFAERDQIVAKQNAPLWRRLRTAFFSLMSRNAVHIVDRFKFPPESLVEIGRRVEL
jgi:KUP system potassium uptake protein